MIAFVHIERAGGTTLHMIFRNNYPLGHFALTPWFLWSNEKGNVLTAKELRALVRCFPYMKSFGGHTVRSNLDYGSVTGRSVNYITFVRDPVKRYLSHFNHQCNVMGKNWTIDKFLAERRFDNYITRRVAGRFDIELAKQRLAEEFTFVGLTDRFDESLVLMRAELNLPTFRIHYQRQNAARDLTYSSHPQVRDPHVIERVRHCNQLDLELFEFLQADIYPRYVERFGPGLSDALARFRKENAEYRFPAWRRLTSLAHRHLVYRHVERLIHAWEYQSEEAEAGTEVEAR